MAPRLSLSRPWFDEKEIEAVRRVLASGWVVQGPEVEAFEAAIATLHQTRHCIAVSSGTAALHVCYLALGIGRGDAVFIPSFAWPSAANMAKLAGAQPVFVDVLPGTYNVDATDLEGRIGNWVVSHRGKPRALVPVHEFGLAADMQEIVRIAAQYSLSVIEDAACALGAHDRGRPVGTAGALGIFSFHPRKSITTGEGGAIITNDTALAERCRQWRNHGQSLVDGERQFMVPGLNYRMTEIQAAVGRVQLTKLSACLEKRRSLARIYFEALDGCPGLTLPAKDPEHTWQTFMIVLGPHLSRKEIIAELNAEGIEAGPGSIAGHLGAHFQPQPALPVSETLHQCGLALPLHPAMKSDDAARAANALKRALERCAQRPQPE